MTVAQLAALSGVGVAVVAALIAFIQMRLTRRTTLAVTRPMLTVSLEVVPSDEHPFVEMYINNSASVAPALDVRIESVFVPRNEVRLPPRVEGSAGTVILPQERVRVPVPPSANDDDRLSVEELVMHYSSVLVRASYRAPGRRRRLSISESIPTVHALSAAVPVTHA